MQNKPKVDYRAERDDSSVVDNSPYYSITKIHKGRYKDEALQFLVSWSDGSPKSWISYDLLNSAAQQYTKDAHVPITGRKPRQ